MFVPPTFCFDWIHLGFPAGPIVVLAVVASLVSLSIVLTRRGVRKGWVLLLCVVLFISADLLVYAIAINSPANRPSGPITRIRNDILQISVALQRFKTQYGQYPRNTLKLCSHAASYDARVAFDQQSLAFIAKMWPNLGGSFSGINWANRPNFDPNNPAIDVLDGDQCLVFFLAGPPADGNNPTAGLWGGFSTNPRNPLDPNTNKEQHIGIGQLMVRPASPLTVGRIEYNTSTAFPSFADAYSTAEKQRPIVYFSATNLTLRSNGYDRTANSLGIMPFFSNNDPWTFYHADSFQLISAGLDQEFGPGGLWLPAEAYSYVKAGKDDLTNIYERLMGHPE